MTPTLPALYRPDPGSGGVVISQPRRSGKWRAALAWLRSEWMQGKQTVMVNRNAEWLPHVYAKRFRPILE